MKNILNEKWKTRQGNNPDFCLNVSTFLPLVAIPDFANHYFSMDLAIHYFAIHYFAIRYFAMDPAIRLATDLPETNKK